MTEINRSFLTSNKMSCFQRVVTASTETAVLVFKYLDRFKGKSCSYPYIGTRKIGEASHQFKPCFMRIPLLQQNSKMALKFDLFRHSVFRLFPRGKREKNEGGLMNINDELNKQF